MPPQLIRSTAGLRGKDCEKHSQLHTPAVTAVTGHTSLEERKKEEKGGKKAQFRKSAQTAGAEESVNGDNP